MASDSISRRRETFNWPSAAGKLPELSPETWFGENGDLLVTLKEPFRWNAKDESLIVAGHGRRGREDRVRYAQFFGDILL